MLEEKANAQAQIIIELEASMDGQTVLTKATDFAASAVLTGSNKDLTEIRTMINHLEASLISQAETLADLSTKTNSGSDVSKNTNKKKARPNFHVCAYRKREVYHKETNCLDLDTNKAKRYPGWKSVFAKE